MATSSTATRVCEKAWIATTYDPHQQARDAEAEENERSGGQRRGSGAPAEPNPSRPIQA